MTAAALLSAFAVLSGAHAEEGKPVGTEQTNIVKQASAPVSSIMQIRLQDTYVPEFKGVDGDGNTFSLAVPCRSRNIALFPSRSFHSLPFRRR